jgi:hypothetical protein
MYNWRRHRPRPRSRKPPNTSAHILFVCTSALSLLLRIVIITWLSLMCCGIFINSATSALGLRTPDVALHSDMNVIALRVASPDSRQLPDLGLQTRFSALAQHLFAASTPEHTFMHDHVSNDFGINASSPSFRCTSPHHLQLRQPWPAAAHCLLPFAHALHASVLSSTSSSPNSTAHHLVVKPQGPRSAHCSRHTYAYVHANMSPVAELLPPSDTLYRLSTRGERSFVLQRFGAAVGGPGSWLSAWRCSSAAGGAAHGSPWRLRVTGQDDSAFQPHCCCARYVHIAVHHLRYACTHLGPPCWSWGGGGVMSSSCALLMSLSPVLLWSWSVLTSNLFTVSVIIAIIIVTILINWLMCCILCHGAELADALASIETHPALRRMSLRLSLYRSITGRWRQGTRASSAHSVDRWSLVPIYRAGRDARFCCLMPSWRLQ